MSPVNGLMTHSIHDAFLHLPVPDGRRHSPPNSLERNGYYCENGDGFVSADIRGMTTQ